MVKSEEEQGKTQTCQRSYSAEASRAAASPFGSAPYLPSPRRTWPSRGEAAAAATGAGASPGVSPLPRSIRAERAARSWRLDEEGGVGGDSRARTQKWAPLRRLALGQGERESILGVHLKVKGVFFPLLVLLSGSDREGRGYDERTQKGRLPAKVRSESFQNPPSTPSLEPLPAPHAAPPPPARAPEDSAPTLVMDP